jgi:REP element-mobilizing transposase RayT
VIVDDDQDRQRFLFCIERMAKQYGIRIHTYCLMTNHYHLILETPQANLSRAVQWLNVSYASYYNRRHHYTGHLFQGRFKAILVEVDQYLESLSRYIHLNPVRAKMALHPWQYPWSSCRFFVNSSKPLQWLKVDRVLSGFGRSRKTASK